MKETKQCLAEFLGTFYLCFAGIAAILSTQAPINSGAGLVGIALAHGLALSIAVSVFGGLSGAHFNPAVTIGMLATGRIKIPLAVSYIAAQLLGSTVAAHLCKFVFPAAAVESANLGIPLPGPWLTENVEMTVLVVEFVLTFLLMTSIFGTAVDERGKAVKIGGFGIGLTVAFDILAGGAVTGASMNPARSFGPALAQMDFHFHWCYWAAPIAGAVVGALLYQHVILPEEAAGKK
jgi:MIP family channel proteins